MSSGSVSEDWLGRLMGVREPWRVVSASAPEGDAEGFVEIEVGHGGGPLARPECGKPAKRHDARRPSKWASHGTRRPPSNPAARMRAPLKRTRFLWLRSAKSLEDEQRARLDGLRRQYGDLGRAWGIKEWAMSLWTGRERAEVEGRWRERPARAQRSRLKPMVKVAQTARNHLQGIVTAVCTGVTNARAESVNAKIQRIKRIAHGDDTCCHNHSPYKPKALCCPRSLASAIKTLHRLHHCRCS